MRRIAVQAFMLSLTAVACLTGYAEENSAAKPIGDFRIEVKKVRLNIIMRDVEVLRIIQSDLTSMGPTAFLWDFYDCPVPENKPNMKNPGYLESPYKSPRLLHERFFMDFNTAVPDPKPVGYVLFSDLSSRKNDSGGDYWEALEAILSKMIRMDISFQGGSVNDFYALLGKNLGMEYKKLPEQLRRLLPEAVTFQVEIPPELFKLKLPPIEVKKTTMERVYGLLQDMERRQGVQAFTFMMAINCDKVKDRNSPLEIQLICGKADSFNDLCQLRTYNMSALANVSPESFVSAVQACLEMSGQMQYLEVKYHEPSKALIVKALKSNIAVSDCVFHELSNSWEPNEKVAVDESVTSLNKVVMELRSRLEKMESDSVKLKEETAKNTAVAQKGQEQLAEGHRSKTRKSDADDPWKKPAKTMEQKR